jgi:hypothetical protein
MTAAFFWDRTGECKDPRTTIDALGGSRAKPYLSSFWTGSPNLELPANNAILMSGITDDLQRALQSDVGQGLKEIRVKDLMAIWYVRWRRGFTDSVITVVSIASVQGYWDLKLNDPDNSSGYRWLRLYQGHTFNGGVTLDVLANQLLPLAKGAKPWKLDHAEVADEEGFLRSRTPPGLAMSPVGGGRLVGDLHVVFDGVARQATIDRANQYITDPIARQRIQGGFPTVTEQFMQDVGRSEIRVGGDRAHGTLLKATGGEDPRVALRRFAGTDAGALNLSKFVNQLPIKAITDKGARVAFTNANGKELELVFPHNGVLPGNATDKFMSVQPRGNGFVIDYEIESPLSGFSVGRTDLFDLDVGASWLKALMQISISAGELGAGNLTSSSYTFTKPPEVTIHTEMTTASLAQQVAGKGV